MMKIISFTYIPIYIKIMDWMKFIPKLLCGYELNYWLYIGDWDMRGKKMTAKERRIKLEEDAKERRKIFKELCDHVSKGYSLDCFAPICEKTVEKYLSTYPDEFSREELKDSMRQGKGYWEEIGHRQARGDCLGNSRTWYYNMANRYGWREKIEIEAEHKGAVNINVVSYASKKQLTDKSGN